MQKMHQIVENYAMGFITPLEAIMQMRDLMTDDSKDAISLKMSEILAPFASHMCGIIEGSGKSIKDFGKRKRVVIRKPAATK